MLRTHNMRITQVFGFPVHCWQIITLYILCTYMLVCDLFGWHCVFRVYQCWVRLRFSLPNRYLTTALGARPGPICILHSPKCPNDEMRASWYTLGYWSDVADMSHHRSYYICILHSPKCHKWWALHTVQIDSAVYLASHRLRNKFKTIKINN